MKEGDKLDALLCQLAMQPVPPVTDGFIEAVWERIGSVAAQRERRTRLGLFLGLFMVGLGAGWGTVWNPVESGNPRYALVANADLSPAALLHAGP